MLCWEGGDCVLDAVGKEETVFWMLLGRRKLYWMLCWEGGDCVLDAGKEETVYVGKEETG
jgi:hypothetical protein